MTARDDIPSELDPLLRQALAWVIRLHSGEATSADASALAQWRQRSPDHDAAFRDAVRLWRATGEAARSLPHEVRHVPVEAGLVPVGKVPIGAVPIGLVAGSAAKTAVGRRALLGGAMAAAACAAGGYLAVRPPLGLWPSLQEMSADYRTAKGERRKIALSDDISVTLNTQTSIAVRSGQDAPAIELISGEALVQALRGASPEAVVVSAAGGRVTARQANFNVKCLDSTVSVSCLDGNVEIEWGGQRTSLPGGQQLSYSVQAGLGSPSRADTEATEAWRNGLLIVRDWPVDRLVEEINRYRPGRIMVMDAPLGRRMVSGTFHLDHLDDFIVQAERLFGATARTLPGGIVLLS